VKPLEIDKRLIYRAWEKVRANKGAPGVDAVSIGLFEQQWRDNLYKLWNRMSSGSYFPGPVRGVEIPKDHGEGVRLLGVPNTADRVAQTAAAMLLRRSWSRSSTPAATGTVLGEAPTMPWPYAASGAGSRTGCSIWTSGPFSTPFRIPCCSRR
jgi:retron-type reverse transcriptase